METCGSSVVSVLKLKFGVTEKAGQNCKSKHPAGYINRKNDVPVVLMATQVFCYRYHLGKEINRERWVDQEVNLPVKK